MFRYYITSFHINHWRCRYGEAEPLLKKENKMEINSKIYHITYGISHDFNLEGHNIIKKH